MGGSILERDFYTFRGYSLHSARRRDSLTASMEDYLEMIYRLSRAEGFTRVHEIAAALHVQPPSASKMIQQLARGGLIKYEKYSIVRLTDHGEAIGEYLIRRHNSLERFLNLIGVHDALEDAERIEHNISNAAMAGLEELLAFFSTDCLCREAWESHLRRVKSGQSEVESPERA